MIKLIVKIDNIPVMYDTVKDHYFFITNKYLLAAYRGSCVAQMFNRLYFDKTGIIGALK